MRAWRYLLAGFAVLFVACVVVQVFLAGVGLFGAGSMSLHTGFGWVVAMVPIAILAATAPARAGRRTSVAAAGLLVLAVIQVSLPGLRSAAPVVAALHPVNALLLFGGGLAMARRCLDLAGSGRPSLPGKESIG
jgi:hypothetical protein